MRSFGLLAVLMFGLTAARGLRAAEGPGERVETLQIERGNLSVLLRDNTSSPEVLSGIDSLEHRRDAPGVDAFDPDGKGSSAGLNFEHVIGGHANPANQFSPRHGRYELWPGVDKNSATLVRAAADDPWALESTFKYTVTAADAVDFEFACRPRNRAVFGAQGYAVLFFANYMNDVEDVALHFRGVAGPGETEHWISADAPPGAPDYKSGGTYRSLPAAELAYDADHNFKLNLWSYDFPRFTQPFYYGRAAHGMVLILMLDRMYSETDEIRFSLFKFKLPRRPRPAWDFQYVIHQVEEGRQYGFKGRMIWKKFVSADDCWAEYRRWRRVLPAEPGSGPPGGTKGKDSGR